MTRAEFIDLFRNQPVEGAIELWDRLEAAEEVIAALTIEPEEETPEEPATEEPA